MAAFVVFSGAQVGCGVFASSGRTALRAINVDETCDADAEQATCTLDLVVENVGSAGGGGVCDFAPVDDDERMVLFSEPPLPDYPNALTDVPVPYLAPGESRPMADELSRKLLATRY